ncbi:MAG TPA: autotransporter domain-containing protein [Xanthobacteraceae bacterium]
MREGRSRTHLLLASSSVAALLIGGGAPPALAAVCNNTITASFDNPSPNVVTNVCVQNTSFTGNITNEGTINPNGITFQNGTITGVVQSTGTINGGISLDALSQISAGTHRAITATNSLSGGITNAGTVSSAATGIFVRFMSSYGGGITNSGAIAVGNTANGISAANISLFSNGITNSGTISGGTNAGGIQVGFPTPLNACCNISTFTGGITNSGLIAVANSAIKVDNVGTFTAGILNSGTISVGGFAAAVVVDAVNTFSGGITNQTLIKDSGGSGIALFSVSTFTGGITNTGTISVGAFAAGIALNSVTTFSGGIISNSGTITGATGIRLSGATVTGAIIDSGTILATGNGIAIDATSKISSTSTTVKITGPTFTGGITNAGTIATNRSNAVASATAVQVQGVTNFAGGISNSGLISASIAGDHNARGILVDSVATFNGGITNSGTVTFAISAGHVGTDIRVSNVASFGGNISNGGTLTAPGSNGINVIGVSTFTGSVTNSGTISATFAAINIQNVSTFTGGLTNSGSLTAAFNLDVGGVATFGGGVSNSGTITALSGGQDITVESVSTFFGGVTNSGSISGGSNIRIESNATFFGGVVNSGTISGSFGIVVEANGTVHGGITNSRIISATQIGILVSSVAVFGSTSAGGGITNSGTITATAGSGIQVRGVSTFTGNITNQGTIAAPNHPGIYLTSVTTFAGMVTNSGTITARTGIKIDTGVTFVGAAGIANSGTITGTGGTAIDASAASSAVTINQTAGLLAGAILLSANADILNVTGGTIAGNIVGSGASDTVNFNLGAGAFTLANTFNLTGVNALNVLSGTVILDGNANSASDVTVSGGNLQIGDAANTTASLTSTLVDVSAAGTLSGHGTITAAVLIDAGGTLAPGGSIGTLTINGSLVFLPGSSYAIELSPTQHSLTNVIGAPGTVQINGGTVVVTPHLGSYGATTFAILTSTGILTASPGFNPVVVQNGSATLADPTLSYDAHDVFLSFGAGVSTLVLPAHLTTNQRDVGTGINNFVLGGGTVPGQFQALAGLSGGALPGALDQLSGEASTGAERGAFQLMDQFLQLMLDPFVDGRSGPIGVGGTAPGFAPETPASLPPSLALEYARVLKAPPRAAPPEPHWTGWGAAFGGSNQTNGDAAVVGSHNVSTQAYGFAAGMDYHYSPHTVFGFALAGGGTGWSLAQGLGGGSSDAFQAGVYATTRNGPLYVAGALDFGNFWMSTNRFAFAGDRLGATFTAQGYGARLESGYHFAAPVVGVTPYAALQSLGFHAPSYGETDFSGGGFALTYGARNATDTRSELGLRFDRLQMLNGMPLTLRARLAWAHDWVSDPALGAAFQALPGSNFMVFGAAAPKDSALTSFGAELRMTPTMSVAAKFDGQFGDGSQTYAGSATMRWSW